MKKQILISAVSLMALSLAVSASAAMVRTGEKYNLNAGESAGENLYVVSGDINISGNVLGDLMAGGGNIVVTGKNSRDVMLIGGSVSVLGPVSDDLRLIGGNLIIGKDVGGDLSVAGGNIHLLSGATIGGEMIAAGGSITVDGTVTKDLAVMGGELTINGKVLGNVRAKNIRKLTLGSNAEVVGNLEYASRNDAVIMDGARVSGKTIHSPVQQLTANNQGWMASGKNNGFFRTLSMIFNTIKLLAYLTAILLLVHFFKKELHSAAEELQNNFWPETLRGFLVSLAMPFLILILAITIIGLIPAFLTGMLYLGLWIFAKIFTSVFIGAWIFKKLSKEKMLAVNWQSAVLGLLCFLALREIPIIGWLAVMILLLASLGELSNLLYRKTQSMLSK